MTRNLQIPGSSPTAISVTLSSHNISYTGIILQILKMDKKLERYKKKKKNNKNRFLKNIFIIKINKLNYYKNKLS